MTLRTPNKTDKANAELWLIAAQHELSRNEYHRVKQLCRQIIRVLWRKTKELRGVRT